MLCYPAYNHARNESSVALGMGPLLSLTGPEIPNIFGDIVTLLFCIPGQWALNSRSHGLTVTKETSTLQNKKTQTRSSKSQNLDQLTQAHGARATGLQIVVKMFLAQAGHRALRPISLRWVSEPGLQPKHLTRLFLAP